MARTAERPNPGQMISRQGQYAGVVSRGLAFAADVGALWGLYVLGGYGLSIAWELITGNSFDLSKHDIAAVVVLVVWWFVYFSLQWTLGGRTIGMAFFGVRVVQKDGRAIRGSQAVLRALLLYGSFLFFVVAGLLIMVQRERRTLHDLIASTAVVYSWDARAARLRWLADRTQPEPHLAEAHH
jgi:uncharacterized RDD family membrane protein YckC